MRPRPALAPPRAVKLVAQVPPPTEPAPTDDGAAPPAPPPAPAPDGAADPAAGATAAPPPAPVEPTSDAMSDAELAKLIAEQEAKEEVIVVTGSTIGRKQLTTPAPLTVLDRELLLASGRTTIGDIIQSIPSQAGGFNANINNTGDGTTRIDLRGLGSARTLVLINGRRVVTSGNGANVSVDINTIPLAIVERVEVLKDGASAIYGSDAIGGVVNIITRSDFEGSEATLYTGGSQRGDGLAYDASFVTGLSSENKKGNVVFAAGMQGQRPVFAGDRAFSEYDMAYDYEAGTAIRGGSTAAPGGRINTRTIDTTGDGRPDEVNLCGAGVQYCTSDGAGGYRPFDGVNDLYNYQPVNYLYTPSSRYHVFGAGTYKLRPSASAFFEASYLNRKSEQQIAAETFLGTIPISRASMYNPIGGTVLGYQRRLEEFGPRTTAQSIDTFRIVGGFKGTLPQEAPALPGFKWELSYNYGRTDAEIQSRGNLIRSRLATALGPSFVNANGVPTCGTPTAPVAGCIPIDILGPSGSIDPAAADYVTFTGVRSGFNEQRTVLAQMQGRLAKLPNNGDISLAFGGDFRQEAGGITPDPLTATGDTTGNAVAPTKGSYNVVEGYAELSLVPLSNKRFAKWIELDLAARGFRYTSFGSGVTWKAGGLFRTVGGFAVRGTYSTAFRAPSVLELYQGTSDVFVPIVDPCDTRPRGTTIELDPDTAMECARQGVPANAVYGTATAPVRLGGNPDLDAETARVLTAGVVFEPPVAKGLSLTVDYWRNDIQHAIQALGLSVAFANCYTRHIQAACDQIHRNPALNNAIQYVDIPNANVGGAAGSGVDVALAFDRKLGGAGRFRQQLESQYLLRSNLDNTYQVVNGLGNYDLGARPRIRATFASTWQHAAGAGGGFTVRYIHSYTECDANACNSGAPSREVAAWYKVDLFGSYTLKTSAGATSLTVGVNNLLDRDPPSVYGSGLGDSDPATYDYVGRYFYARMSQQF